MQTLKLALSESQYKQLQREARERGTSVTDLVLEAVEAFLRTADAKPIFRTLPGE